MIVVHDLAKETTFDADGVRGKFGVSPSQIPDYLGLVGDVVDNLPGVPGIGAKSAAAILQVFESIEAIPVGGGALRRGARSRCGGRRSWPRRSRLHRERALATKSLATVLRERARASRPGSHDLAYHGADRARIEQLFDRLGWSRIRDRVSALAR